MRRTIFEHEHELYRESVRTLSSALIGQPRRSHFGPLALSLLLRERQQCRRKEVRVGCLPRDGDELETGSRYYRQRIECQA